LYFINFISTPLRTACIGKGISHARTRDMTTLDRNTGSRNSLMKVGEQLWIRWLIAGPLQVDDDPPGEGWGEADFSVLRSVTFDAVGWTPAPDFTQAEPTDLNQ
jgi:hypothetical protein